MNTLLLARRRMMMGGKRGTPTPPDNEIWYTTVDGEVANITTNATLVSNVYAGGKGVATFNGSVVKLNTVGTTVTEVILPALTVGLGDRCFENNSNFIGSLLDFSNIESIGLNCFYNCVNFSADVNAPRLTSLGYYVGYNNVGTFYNSGIKSFEAPLLQEIYFASNGHFDSCRSLTSVKINSCTKIGDNAFRGCSNIEHFEANSVQTIGNSVFNNALKNIELVFPELTALGFSTGIGGQGVFQNSGVAKFSAPKLTTISSFADGGAFLNCTNLVDVKIPSCTKIGEGAFKGCSNIEHFEANSVQTIGNNAFNNALKNIELVFPELTALGTSNNTSRVFGGSGLTKFSAPKLASLVSYPYGGVFRDSLNLKEVNLQNCTEIGANAFNNCRSLDSLMLGLTPPIVGGYSFERCPLSLIRVPMAVVDAYKADTFWSQYANRIQGY